MATQRIKTQNSRSKLFGALFSGNTPTLGPTSNHKDGTWTVGQIYPGELFFNHSTQALFIGYNNLSGTSGVTQIITSPFSGTSGGASTLVQNGLNTYTGGTYLFPTVNISGANLNNIIVSGNSVFSGGNFLVSATTANIGNGPFNLQMNSLFSSLTNSGLTGGYVVLSNGNLQIAGPSIDWSNTLINLLSGDLIVSGNVKTSQFSANTYYSGTTPLETIIRNIASVYSGGSGTSTYVQPGTNTYTGGTYLLPTVNVSAATLQRIYVTGTSDFGGSYFNVTGGTISLSGTSVGIRANGGDLNLIQTDAGDINITNALSNIFVQGAAVNITSSGDAVLTATGNLFLDGVIWSGASLLDSIIYNASPFKYSGTGTFFSGSTGNYAHFGNTTFLSASTGEYRIFENNATNIAQITLYNHNSANQRAKIWNLGNDLYLDSGNNTFIFGNGGYSVFTLGGSFNHTTKAVGGTIWSKSNSFSYGSTAREGFQIHDPSATTITNVFGIRNTADTAFVFSVFGGNSGGTQTSGTTITDTLQIRAFNPTSPQIYADSDTNTGLMFDGPDILSLHTGGAQRILINAAGYITNGSQLSSNWNTYFSGNSRFDNLSAATISASTYYSGTTPLESIISTIASSTPSTAATYVTQGLNTYTGGSATLVSVNISAATLTYLSATTISGGTIYSGSTNIENIFLAKNSFSGFSNITVGTIPGPAVLNNLWVDTN